MNRKKLKALLADNYILTESVNNQQRLDLILNWLSYFKKPFEIYQYVRVYVSAYFHPESKFNKHKCFDIVVQIRAFRFEDGDEELIKEMRSSYFNKDYFIEYLQILTELSLIFPLVIKEIQKNIRG